HKGVPGNKEHVTWPGDYHYLANSVIESGKTGIPVVNDLPNRLPIPGLDQKTPHNDAKSLSHTLRLSERSSRCLPCQSCGRNISWSSAPRTRRRSELSAARCCNTLA